MTIKVVEAWDSREGVLGDNDGKDLRFFVHDTNDDAEVYAALITATTQQISHSGHTITRQNISARRVGDMVWEGIVHYGNIPYPGDSIYNFDTGGGTQTITQSIQTIGNYTVSGLTAPNFNGGINVTKDAVNGTEVVLPVFNFSETHYIDASLVTEEYKALLADITGTMNGDTFRLYPAGEILFLGASGSLRDSSTWEITYRFSRSPNATNLVIGGTITVPSKLGWDYLWVRYEDVEDTGAKMLVKRPISVHVERVYHFGNFASMGI